MATYTLESTGMHEGYYPFIDQDWDNFFMGTSTHFRVGYASGYRLLNCLFDESTLASLRTKTITSIKLTITIVSGTIYRSDQFPIRYKYNNKQYELDHGDAWASSDVDSTQKAHTNIAYLRVPDGNPKIVCDNTKFTIDLGTALPKYGYVIGTVQSNRSAWYTLRNTATLTVVTTEAGPEPTPDPEPSRIYGTKAYPMLFGPNEESFYSNGLGALYDTLSCEVSEELNGKYELQMTYPITGIHYNEIEIRSIILAKPNMVDRTQPFRVYRITNPLNGKVRVYAEHISYDLNGVPISPFSVADAGKAVEAFNTNSLIENGFIMYTNQAEVKPMTISKPISYRSALGGTDESLLETYGGELKFDWYDIYFLDRRGSDIDVVLRYGNNLANLEQDTNATSTYSGVIGYWANSDGVSEVQGDIIYASQEHTYDKIYSLDVTEQFESKPTKAQVNQAVQEYISEYHPEIPEFSITVAYQDNPELMDVIGLGDYVKVIFTKLGVNGVAECTKTVYDCLRRRYKSINLGEVQDKIAATFSNTVTRLTQTRQRLIDETRHIIKQLTEEADSIRSSISDVSGSTTQITQRVNSIETAVSGLNSSLTYLQDQNSATWTFVSQVNDALSNVEQVTDSRFADQERYIRFEDGVIKVGIMDNAVLLTMRNDTVEFGSPDGSRIYAYFSNDQFEVPSINARYIQFGHSDVYRDFYWTVRDNGHITLLR